MRAALCSRGPRRLRAQPLTNAARLKARENAPHSLAGLLVGASDAIHFADRNKFRIGAFFSLPSEGGPARSRAMKDTLVRKLDSFKAALAVSDEESFRPLWLDQLPVAFTEGVVAARERVAVLASQGADQTAGTSGSTDTLRDLRGRFEATLAPIARAVFRCLQSLDRLEDAARADLTPSDMRNARAQTLAGFGERILELAEPLTVAPAAGGAAPGEKFGITAASVATLDALWERFSTVIGLPAGARARRKALTGQLPSAFSRVEEEFAILDDLILQFDDRTGPGHEFVEAWFNARRVQDTGRRSARAAEPARAISPAPAPASPAPASPSPSASPPGM